MIRAADLGLSLAAIIAAMGAAGPLHADGVRVRTELGVGLGWADATSLDAALGFRDTATGAGGLRLMWEPTTGPLRFEFHSRLTVLQGDSVGLATALAPLGPAPPPATLFDLTSVWAHDADTLLAHTVDRASLAFTTDNLVLKIGRQAMTWGGGLVFHPADVVAPFAPDAIDTSYKPGVDMIYGQYLFDNGADIQAIAVPRPATMGGDIAYGSSTYAALGSFSAGELDGRLLYARDRGDTVAGLGASGPLGGASWTVEYLNWWLSGGETHASMLANISNFGTLGGRNVYYFAEYFHNGFGVAASIPLDAIPASLQKRVSTGQVFYTGRDFLALGSRIELTPDLSLSPGAIIELNDGSALISLAVDWSLGDNTDLSFHYFHPLGADGTEFGGRETSAGSGVYSGQSRNVSLRLVHYF